MGLVCLDNHVLIWGIKEEASPGQEPMIPLAKSYLKHLADTSTNVIIPSVVVAEFLMRIPTQLHATVTNLFNKSFTVAPFDTAAATNFARIWQTQKDKNLIEELILSGKTKQELKIDSMIVAIAVSRGAELIISHDEGLKRFADGFIPVHDIPFISQQNYLL